MSKIFKFHYYLTSITLGEDVCVFVIMSHRITLKTRNVSGKFVEKIKTNFMFSKTFSEIMLRDNVEKFGRDRQTDKHDSMTIRHAACALHAG